MSTRANKYGDIALLAVVFFTSLMIFCNDRPSSTFFRPPYSVKHLAVDSFCIALFTTTILVYSFRAVSDSTRTIGNYFGLMSGKRGETFPLALKLFILIQVIGITFGDFLLAFLFVFGNDMKNNAKPGAISCVMNMMLACITIFLVSLIASSISIWIKCTGRDKKKVPKDVNNEPV